MMIKIKKFFSNLYKKSAFQTIITSIGCALIGLIVGFIALAIINPGASWEGFKTMSLGFLKVPVKYDMRTEALAKTITRTAPLIVAGVAILFAYKAGLFNIGASGQYTMGVLASLFCAYIWNMPWYVCIVAAILAGALWGAIAGFLKAFLNVNEVISGIMLNWIGLYLSSMIIKGQDKMWWKTLSKCYDLKNVNATALLPNCGLDKLFADYQYITIGVFIALFVSLFMYILLEKTTFGYEIKATGFNKNAARYAGMKEKKNIVITLAISGALAGLAAPLLYLTGIEPWECPASVPAMGFDGISAAFLGGLNPIGTIFSSFFITHISIGGSRLDTSFYTPEIAKIVTSLIIYLCAFVLFVKDKLNKKVLDSEKALVNKKIDEKEENNSDDKNVTKEIKVNEKEEIIQSTTDNSVEDKVEVK